ncbi:GntR family transcriptional regulator [Sinorhizobium meliloti]|nr:GntR family transcriptional regulator [Sinorhizobium meliloti]
MRTAKLNGETAGAGTRDLAHQIERDINVGRVSPGSWLKQIDLERTYGVSRLSVRQALERLAERGHVELFPNRGYRVKEFDLQRFNNIINIRAVLEVAAAEMVVGTVDAQSIERYVPSPINSKALFRLELLPTRKQPTARSIRSFFGLARTAR